MPPCHCEFRGCDGKIVPRSTRSYHLRQDQKTRLQSTAESSKSSSHLGPSHNTNSMQPEPRCSSESSEFPMPSMSGLSNSQCSSSQVDEYNGPSGSMDVEDMQSELLTHSAAEERGRVYMEDMANSAAAPTLDDDIGGDVDGDLSGSEDEPTPGPAPNTSLHDRTDVHIDAAGSQAAPSVSQSQDENHPDPFYIPYSSTSEPSLQRSTSSPVFMLYLLVSWLHTHFHLPFLACNAVLVVVLNVLRAAGHDLAVIPPPYTTLPSVVSHLGVEPNFQALPVCSNCLEVFPATTKPGILCHHCALPLFKSIPRHNRRTAKDTESHRPFLQFPYKSIESQLRDILAVPGMVGILEQWRLKARMPGYYTDNFDGAVCKELPGADGRPFFENPRPQGSPPELRLGVTLGADWFSYLRSLISPSHTSGPISFNLINLPLHLKYRTANIMLGGIMPGPKEQTPDQVQRFMRIFVNELLRLWEVGFSIYTTDYPMGLLVRVILICVICDKPAAHKLGGFGSHSHTFFCTRCWISQSEKGTAAAFQRNAFLPRTHSEHLRHAQEYAKCDTQAARDRFVKDHAARWFELARLPYFDICRMIIIDPMHNLLLGLVKTHFYHIWIQLKVLRKTKELRRFHDILSKLQIPLYLGRLPVLMGQPAGGSLTADQWLVAATVVCPIAIPQIWDEYCSGDPETVRLTRIAEISKSIADKKAAQAAARRAKAAAKKQTSSAPTNAAPGRPQRKRRRTARSLYVDDDPESELVPDAGAIEEEEDVYIATNPEVENEDDSSKPPNLHPQDPSNFSKLAAALKLLLAWEIDDADIDEADRLLREYCSELIYLYGPDVMRPNHHYATHIPPCIRDFGPLHTFWTFLFERINKVLKSYNSANHAGGDLETSFFREFHRTVQQSRVMAQSFREGDSYLKHSINTMYHATADDRGTVQALSKELDDSSEDGGIYFALSPRYFKERMNQTLYNSVLTYLRSRLPLPIISHLALGSNNSVPLLPQVTFFDYAVVHQRRYWASSRNNNIANSLIAVKTGPNEVRVGELTDIFVLDQPQLGLHRFGHVRWLVPANVDLTRSTWGQSDTLRIGIWAADVYTDVADAGPGPLIQLDTIVSHVVRAKANVVSQLCWVTVMLDRAGRRL